MSRNNINMDSEMNEPAKDSNEIMISEPSIRNLFHLGYNSRSLTKSLANSIKFHEVVRTIKTFIENDELSLRSMGPILLGLTRLYDKQMKAFMEDLSASFKLKKPNKEANEKQEVKSNKNKKSKIEDEETDDTHLDSQVNNSDSNGYSSNMDVLSLSPLHNGLFSLMNKEDSAKSNNFTFMNSTPGKDNLVSPNSIGMFRDNNDSSKSKTNLNFLNNSDLKDISKLKGSNVIFEQSIFDEEFQDKDNNFFNYISENVNKEEMLNHLNDLENFGENFNLDQKIFNSEEKSNLKFADLTAADLTTLNTLNKINKKQNYRKVELEYDEDIQMSLEEGKENSLASENKEEMMYNFKAKMLLNKESSNYSALFQGKTNSTYSYNTPNIDLDRKLNYTGDLDYHLDKQLADIFTNLDVNDFGLDINDKLNKIAEDIKNEEKEMEEASKSQEKEENKYDDNNFGQNDDVYQQENFPLNDDHPANKYDSSNSDQLDKFYSSVSDVLEKVKTKKKEVTFVKLNKEIKSESHPHQNFYNLLILAQADSIKLQQREMFVNESIFISKS